MGSQLAGKCRRRTPPSDFPSSTLYHKILKLKCSNSDVWCILIFWLHFFGFKSFGFKFTRLQNSLASNFQGFNFLRPQILFRQGRQARSMFHALKLSQGTRFLKEILRKPRRAVCLRALGPSRRVLEVGAWAIDEYYFGFKFFGFKFIWLHFFSSSKLFGFKFICLQIYPYTKLFSSKLFGFNIFRFRVMD